MNPMQVDLPFLFSDRDRSGRWRLYVRRNGRKIRMRHPPGTDAFAEAYAAAVKALDRPKPKAKHEASPGQPLPGTLGALALAWFRSGEFLRREETTKRRRRAIIEACLGEPRKIDAAGKPEGMEIFRDCPIAKVTAAHVRVLRDRLGERAGAANQRRKVLSAMFGWAAGLPSTDPLYIASNPVRDVKKIRYATEGWHTWTSEEVEQYQARHPLGTKARLALALLLYTGARRSDVVKLGRPHMSSDGWLRFVPTKTRHVRAEPVEIPIVPELAKAIAAGPTGELTFLMTDFRRPFTVAGFGNRFRSWCDEAGLPHCSAHGLRKAGATLAAENGASDRALMAIFGWSSESQATPYTRRANRKKLAEESMPLIKLTRKNARSGS